MKKTLNIFSIIIIVCLAAYSGYLYGSHQRQKELDLQMELINYSVLATDVQTDLGLLQMLKDQKTIETENKLETYLDISLASLGNYEAIAKKHPNPEIFKAIKNAKLYRQQNQSHEIHPKLSKGVELAFSVVD